MMNEKQWEVTFTLTITEIASNGFEAVQRATMTLEEMEESKDIKNRLVATAVKPLPEEARPA